MGFNEKKIRNRKEIDREGDGSYCWALTELEKERKGGSGPLDHLAGCKLRKKRNKIGKEEEKDCRSGWAFGLSRLLGR